MTLLSKSKGLIPSTTITTAVTGVIGEEIIVPAGIRSLSVQANFSVGTGGTSAKVYVQTTFDGGATWVDIMCFAFANTPLRVVSSVRPSTAVAANYTATAGTLTDNTIKDGLIGDKIRTSLTTVGTYSGGTALRLDAVFC